MTAYREEDPFQKLRADHTKLEARVHSLEVRADGESRRHLGQVFSGEFWRKLGMYVIAPLSVAVALGPCAAWIVREEPHDLRPMRARTQSCQRACTAIGAQGVDARMARYYHDGRSDLALRCVCVGPDGRLRAFDEDFSRVTDLNKAGGR